MLDFEEYSKILRQWVKDGYPLITDNVLRTQIAEFETKLDDYVTFLKNTVELYKQENDAQSQSVVVQDDELDIV